MVVEEFQEHLRAFGKTCCFFKKFNWQWYFKIAASLIYKVLYHFPYSIRMYVDFLNSNRKRKRIFYEELPVVYTVLCTSSKSHGTGAQHGFELFQQWRQTVSECFRTRETPCPNSAAGFSKNLHFQIKYVLSGPEGCHNSRKAA